MLFVLYLIGQSGEMKSFLGKSTSWAVFAIDSVFCQEESPHFIVRVCVFFFVNICEATAKYAKLDISV